MNRNQNEWDALTKQYPPGTAVTGVVSSCHQFGVFITIDDFPSDCQFGARALSGRLGCESDSVRGRSSPPRPK